MKNSNSSILVTATGGGGIGREILKAFKLAENQYKIVAVDSSPNSLGLFETPHRYIVPEAKSEKYLTTIFDICRIENICAIAPGSEIETEILSKNKTLFDEKNITLLTNSYQTIKLCQDKFNLANYLHSKGISSPKSILYENEHSVNQIDEFPVVIKPRSGAGSRNVYLAHNKDEAIFFGNYIMKYGGDPLIQEYVGNCDAEYTIGIIYADGGKLVTSIAMKRFLEGGLSVRQITVDNKSGKKYVISSGISQGEFDDFFKIREAGLKIAKILDSNGPINIQCRKINDEIIPFEINPRFSGTTGSRSLVGCNEPDILFRYRLFGEIPKQLNYKKGLVLRELCEKFVSKNDIMETPKI